MIGLGAAEIVGIRAMVVHARDEPARSFCERFNDNLSSGDPRHRHILIKDLRNIPGDQGYWAFTWKRSDDCRRRRVRSRHVVARQTANFAQFIRASRAKITHLVDLPTGA